MNDGGSAFPVPTPESTDGRTHDGGMSLRDWFAGMALTGLMNKPSNQRSLAIDDATYCYAIADAMLEARKGGIEP